MAATSYPYVSRAVSVSSVDATPVEVTVGFDVVLIADITGGSAAGDLYRRYDMTTAVAQAATDLTAGDITQIVHDQLVAMASQATVQQYTYVVKLGAGTYAAALAAFVANGYRSGEDYVCLLIDSRADADLVDASDAAEAQPALRFIAQTANADAITSGFPAALSGLQTNAATWPIYEDTDTDVNDARWAARIFGGPLRTQRQSGRIRIAGATEYAAPLTNAQQGHLEDNHINYHTVTTWGSAQRNVAQGDAVDGTSVSLSLAMLVAEVLTTENLGTLLATKTADGTEVVDDDAGRAEVEAAIRTGALDLLAAGWIGPSTALPEGWRVSSFTVSDNAATLIVDYNFDAGIRSITVTNYFR